MVGWKNSDSADLILRTIDTGGGMKMSTASASVLDSGDTSLSLVAAAASEAPSTRNDLKEQEQRSVIWSLAQLEHEFESIESVSIYYAHKNDRSSRYRNGQEVSELSFDEGDDQLDWFGVGVVKNWSIGTSGNLTLELDAAWLEGYSLVSELRAEPEEEFAGESEHGSEESDNALPSGHNTVIIDSTSEQLLSDWGYNLLLTWSPGFWNGSAVTLGYASGGGHFKQTGLHSNDNDFSLYGELFSPELSNIDIATARLSFSWKHNATVYFQFNRYLRSAFQNEEIEANIEFEILADDKELGSEIDISMDYEFSENLQLSVTAAHFQAGKGIATGQDRKLSYFEIDFDIVFDFSDKVDPVLLE